MHNSLPHHREDVQVEDAFHLRPLNNRFGRQAVGHSTLERTLKDLMNAAGYYGMFTLHSLRATCATRLYEANITEQQIMEVTGHKSAAVREYKRTSESMKKDVSEILQENQPSGSNCTPSSSRPPLDASVEASNELEPGPSGKRLKLRCGNLEIDFSF